MARTIVLSTVSVKNVMIDMVNEKVVVLFDVKDAEGGVWESTEATFFVTMPPMPEGGYPISQYELPASYVPTLVGIVTDAKAAIEARYLV